MSTPLPRVLITGGSSGIGKACVEVFARANYEVWFTYRSGKRSSEEVCADLQSNRVRAFGFDQGDRASIQTLLRNLPGCPDIVIHNAALGSATVERYAPDPQEQDQALFQVNALGVLWLTEGLLPEMKKRNSGKIFVLSSVGGGITQFPGFRWADGMSKAAVAFLGKQLAVELAQTGIDVVTVCPGATETAMFEASTLSKLSKAEREEFVARLPKKKLIQPEDIAALLLKLSEDGFSSLLHGAVIDASQGLGTHPGLITGGHRR